jgi:hypothetical protein
VIAALPPFVADVATLCGAFLAFSAVSVLLVRSRPVKWIYRRNVVEPLTTWFRATVQEVVNDELDRRPLTNGWGTQAVHEIAKATGADVAPPRAERAAEDADHRAPG